MVLGKQDLLTDDELGSVAVGVEKTIVHEKWNSFLIMYGMGCVWEWVGGNKAGDHILMVRVLL